MAETRKTPQILEEELVAEPETVVPQPNAIEQLKKFSMLSADTGRYEELLAFYPRYVTTNPTLIHEAIKLGGEYRGLLDAIVKKYKAGFASSQEKVTRCLEEIPVAWGAEILGETRQMRVSTQVDVRLETADRFVQAAKTIVEHYTARGIDKQRVLIKVPATPEGIRACQQLEAQGIHTNVTLVFSLEQAAFAAEAGATVISPFIGCVTDWHRRHQGRDFGVDEDPGVQLAQKCFSYCKAHEHRTMVLAASVRSAEQAIACAGCDLISVPLPVLADLAKMSGTLVSRKFHANAPAPTARFQLSELSSKWKLPQDATELLNQGLRRFADDEAAIEELVRRGIEA